MRPAVVVDDAGDDDVNSCQSSLAGKQGPTKVPWVSHFGNNGEHRCGACEGEGEGCYGGGSICEIGIVHELPVELPSLVGGYTCRSLLHADGDCDGHN